VYWLFTVALKIVHPTRFYSCNCPAEDELWSPILWSGSDSYGQLCVN